MKRTRFWEMIQSTPFFYLMTGIIAFAPCLLGGQAYFDGDLFAQYIPMRMYLKSSILLGHLPLWCPYLLGGQPFFADPNTMSAYPITYLLLPLPVPYGFSLFYFIHFLLAAWGMHTWAKTLGFAKESRLLAGLLFAFSGFFWWEIIHPPLLAAFAWMPWWGAALEKLSQKLEPSWGFAVGLVFAFLFTAGNFQITLGALYGGGAYFIFRLLTRRNWRKVPDIHKRLLWAPLFFIWGALPLLALWIPAWEFMSRCDRLTHPGDYPTFQADYSLKPSLLWQFLVPVKPFLDHAAQSKPMDDYLANAGYLGPWALFMLGMAFKKKPSCSMKAHYFLTAAGGAALLLSFGKYFPLHRFACNFLPGFGLTRAPFRYVFLYVTAGSVIAAWGYERILERLEKHKSRRLPVLLAIAGIYGIGITCLSVGLGWMAWPQWLALALGLISLYCFWRWRGSPIMRWAFPVSLALCMMITAWNDCPSRFGPFSNFDFTGACPALQKMKSIVGLKRIFIGDDVPYPAQTGGQTCLLRLPPDAVYATGLRNAAGYNPLSLAKASDLYALPPQTFMRLMALGAFISGGEIWKGGGFTKEDWRGVQFFKNQEAVSFVYAPRHVETIKDEKKRLVLMQSAEFNPYDTAYFSQPLSEEDFHGYGGDIPRKWHLEFNLYPFKLLLKNEFGLPQLLNPLMLQKDWPQAHLQYELIQDDPDEESFKISINRPGWLVFSEVNFPGWDALVDDLPSPLVSANHIFRTVWVDEGTHRVTFRYEPAWLKPLLFGLLFWVLSVAVLFLGPWRRRFLEEFKVIEGHRAC